MIAVREIGLLFALFLLIGTCQAVCSEEGGEGESHNDMLLPLLLMAQSGAMSVATSAGVCLSTLSVGVAYISSQYV